VRQDRTAIALPSLDKLPSVIDTLITAVRNGELDQQLTGGQAGHSEEAQGGVMVDEWGAALGAPPAAPSFLQTAGRPFRAPTGVSSRSSQAVPPGSGG
jgi:hypothetical protein